MSCKHWPLTLRPSKIMVDITGQSRSGGVSSEGFEQLVVGSAGRLTWKGDFNVFGGTVDGNTLLAARSIKSHLRGRANTVIMPIIDRGNSPAAMAGEAADAEVLSFDDGSFFDDGTGVGQDPTPATAGPAFLGQDTLLVYMLGGHSPQPGQWFGLKGKEAYLIDTATLYIAGANYWTLTFSPTLRRDVVDGEAVDFDDPHVECRMVGDASFGIELLPPMYSTPTLDLVEAVP